MILRFIDWHIIIVVAFVLRLLRDTLYRDSFNHLLIIDALLVALLVTIFLFLAITASCAGSAIVKFALLATNTLEDFLE